MGLLLMEGFEHVRTATDLGRRFPEANSGVPGTLPTQVGERASSRCLRIENGTTAFRTAAMSPGSTTINLGAHIRVHNCANSWPQITVLNSSNNEQFSIHTICPGTFVKFRLMRGATQLYLSDELPMDVYHHVEVQVKVDASFGSWLVRINEMTVAYSTGNVNTANAGGAGYSKVLFNLSTVAGAGNYIELDNLYVDDEDLLGIVVIEGSIPVGRGSYTGLTRFGDTQNYLTVDDADSGGADDDTSYVEMESTDASPDLGTELDLYLMQKVRDVPYGIKNTRASLDAKNSTASNADVNVRSLQSGTRDLTVEGTVQLPASSGYARYKLDLGPKEIEGLEFGPSDQAGGYALP